MKSASFTILNDRKKYATKQILFTMIWKHKPTLEAMNAVSTNTMVEHVGIEFIEIGDDYIKARMPVDHRTVQPMRILHGGASVVLAETIGSVASTFCIEDLSKQTAVGVEINASHLKSAKSGFVYGTARPIKIGRKLHVWNIEIKNEDDKLVCVSRLTIAVINIS